MRRQKKNVPNGRTEQNSTKIMKQNRDEQSTRYRLQNTIITMLSKLRGRLDELSENFNKEIVNI